MKATTAMMLVVMMGSAAAPSPGLKPGSTTDITEKTHGDEACDACCDQPGRAWISSVALGRPEGRCARFPLSATESLGAVCSSQKSTYKATWVVRWTAMKPDGYPREGIAVYDRAELVQTEHGGSLKGDEGWYDNKENPGLKPFPGPELRVRQGDDVEITVINELHTAVTSIHWHGLHMKKNCWMDGVHMMTECGIAPGQSFTYKFKVDQKPGTHWYHAHTGAQFADGMQGPIVILPRKGHLGCRGNHDAVAMLQDWHRETYHSVEAKYLARNGAYSSLTDPATLNEEASNNPTTKARYGHDDHFTPDYPFPSQQSSILINGRGQSTCEMITEDQCKVIREKGWRWWYDRNRTKTTGGQCQPAREPFFGACQKRGGC
eukprot:g1105.t1